MGSDDEKVKRHAEVPFLMIPLAVARDRELSFGAKVLFGAIYSLAHLPDGCHCTKEDLASRIGMSLRNIQRLFQELEQREWISRTIKHRGRSDIRVLWRPRAVRVSDKVSRGDKMSPQSGETKCPDKMSPQRTIRGTGTSEKKSGEEEASSAASSSPSIKRPPASASSGASSPPTPAGGNEEDPGAEQATPEEIAAWRRSIGLAGPRRAGGVTQLGAPTPVALDPETEAAMIVAADAKKAAAKAALARRAKDGGPP